MQGSRQIFFCQSGVAFACSQDQGSWNQGVGYCLHLVPSLFDHAGVKEDSKS